MNHRSFFITLLFLLFFYTALPHPAFATGAGLEYAVYAAVTAAVLTPVPAIGALLYLAPKGTRRRKAGFGLLVCLLAAPIVVVIGAFAGPYGMPMVSLLLFLFVLNAHRDSIKQAGKVLTDRQKKAAAGDPEAQDHVAYSYYAGKGVPVDMAESYFWYSLSAANFRAYGKGEIAKMQEGKRAICREQLTDEQAAAQDKRLAEWRPVRVGK